MFVSSCKPSYFDIDHTCKPPFITLYYSIELISLSTQSNNWVVLVTFFSLSKAKKKPKRAKNTLERFIPTRSMARSTFKSGNRRDRWTPPNFKPIISKFSFSVQKILVFSRCMSTIYRAAFVREHTRVNAHLHTVV